MSSRGTSSFCCRSLCFLSLDQGKPILVSGLALQAELESSTAVYSKAQCGEVTSTAEICSRRRPALVRVAFAVTAVKCPPLPLSARWTAPLRKMLLWTHRRWCVYLRKMPRHAVPRLVTATRRVFTEGPWAWPWLVCRDDRAALVRTVTRRQKQQSWAFSSPPSGATYVVTLFDVSRQLPASSEGRYGTAALLKGMHCCSCAHVKVFSEDLTSRHSRYTCSWDLCRDCGHKGELPVHAKRWHVLFVKLHCGSPSWWRCGCGLWVSPCLSP